MCGVVHSECEQILFSLLYLWWCVLWLWVVFILFLLFFWGLFVLVCSGVLSRVVVILVFSIVFSFGVM